MFQLNRNSRKHRKFANLIQLEFMEGTPDTPMHNTCRAIHSRIKALRTQPTKAGERAGILVANIVSLPCVRDDRLARDCCSSEVLEERATTPYAGINRIRFRGFVLRPNGHPRLITSC